MVVFSAKMETDKAYGPFNEEVTVKYNAVITNIGDAYSPSTGVFTAPVQGVYYFTFFYHAGGHRMANLMLTRNNEIVVMTSDHKTGADTADNGGNAVYLKLQNGDQVCVRMLAGAHVWAGPQTTFSGHLINSA